MHHSVLAFKHTHRLMLDGSKYEILVIYIRLDGKGLNLYAFPKKEPVKKQSFLANQDCNLQI